MAALDYLTERGFTARKVGMRIRVSPASKLTDEVREYIESHRQELLTDLPEYTPPATAVAEKPSTADRPLPRPHLVLVERPRSASRATHQPHSNAASATPAWRQARDQYIDHIMICRSCCAPTGRHCPAGAELRAAYDNTPMEPAQ